MKKLYEVERHFYVMAEDESEAENYIPLDPLACTNYVTEAKTIDAEWADAIPFNSDDDKTCFEILEN